MSLVPNLEKLLIVLFLLWAPLQIFGSEAHAAQLRLTWTDNSNNEDGFTILRKTAPSGSYSTIASVGANVTSYTDSTVIAGTTHCYQVAAFNSAGQSAKTPEACGAPAAGGFTLTVTKAGSGSGSVSSSPGGINGCTSSCSASFSGTVQLTANPSAGSSFAGWSGGGCNGTAGCTVNLTANTAVTATFNLSSASPPPPSPAWTFCANEWAQCNFSGTKEVRYGANGVYISKIFTNGVLCSNSVFGDPIYGFVKKCEHRDVATTAAATTNLASTNQLRTTDNSNQLSSRIGIFRPSTGQWFLDRNGNGVLDCSNDLCINNFGQDGMRPVSGDWNGTGTSSIGTFDIATGSWHLDNGNYSWDSCGAAEDLDLCFTSSAQPGATPVVKENSNGQINIGTYRAQVTTTVNRKQVTKFGVWQFDTDGDGRVDNCVVDLCIEGFGNSSADLPVVGDWNNSGVEKIGFFRSTTGQWFLDLNGNGIWDGSGTDKLIASFGMSGDLPVAGDWAGTGGSQVGVFRPTTGEWFLDLNGNGSWDGCQIDLCIGQFGQPGDFPVVGKW
jgi:hypothetical protein